MTYLIRTILVFCTLIAIVFTLLFVISTWNHFDFAAKDSAAWDNTGQVGDFVGGVIGTVVAAIGSILLYMSFSAQTKAHYDQGEQFRTNIAQQSSEFLKSEIESRFFELIKLHKENLEAINYDNPKDSRHEKLENRKTINYINEQIESCFKEIVPFFERPRPKPEMIYQSAYLEKLANLKKIRPAIDLLQLARIDIAYAIVFFGTTEKDLISLQKLLDNHYLDTFTKPILKYVSLKSLDSERKKAWDNLQKLNPLGERLIKQYENMMEQRYTFHQDISGDDASNEFRILLEIGNYNKYYGGHQFKLGQYFRHLFQTVKYINRQTILSQPDKYDYIKILRAQLSNTEQYLIFYNSLSFMGRAWELGEIAEPSASDTSAWLITNYNFIKNIQDLKPFDQIEIASYYPDLHFEFEKEPVTRQRLIASLSSKAIGQDTIRRTNQEQDVWTMLKSKFKKREDA